MADEEGGGGPSFTELWNAAKDVAILFQDGQSVDMGTRAFAVPKGLEPTDITWESGQEETKQYTLNWSSLASELGVSSGTSAPVGVTWTWGYGTSDIGSGYFIHNAYLWGYVDYSGLGQDVEITGQFFPDPIMVQGVAKLTGTVRVDMTYLTLHVQSVLFDVAITGYGSGRIRRK
jgi:hypothetical protein